VCIDERELAAAEWGEPHHREFRYSALSSGGSILLSTRFSMMANRQENDDPKNTSRIPPMAKENHLVLSLKAHLSTIKRLKLNQKKKRLHFTIKQRRIINCCFLNRHGLMCINQNTK
jgi:hypothetical protein